MKDKPSQLQNIIELTIANDPNLRLIKIYEEQISDAAAKDLAEVLKAKKTLTSVHLSYNQISDAGAKNIAEALEENKTVTSFHIDGNQISDVGAQYFAIALTKNKTLVSVSLAHNKITNAGAQHFAEALEENTTLTYLNLDANDISKDILSTIESYLERNRKLKEEEKNKKNLHLNKDTKTIAQTIPQVTPQNDDLLTKQQKKTQEKAALFGKMSAEDLEDKVESLKQKQQEIEHQLAEIRSAISDLDEVTHNSAKRIGNFDFAALPSWIGDLNLNDEQIAALNKIEGFRLEELNDISVKETYEALQANKDSLASILEQQKTHQEEAKKRIQDSNNVYVINDPKNKIYLEQMELDLEENADLKKAALAIQSKFNEHFLVSTALSSGKLQTTQGKLTNALGYASVLIGELPFGGFISGTASTISRFLGENRRANRYEKLGDLIEGKDLNAGSVLSEKIGRKIALTGSVQILQGLKKLNSEKKIEEYYDNLAKSCLENVLNGKVGQNLEETFGDKNPSENTLIKAIGVQAGIIHQDHDLYEISSEKAKKIAANSSKKLSQAVSVDQLFDLITQMQHQINTLNAENVDMKKRISDLEQQKKPATSPSPTFGETKSLSTIKPHERNPI